MDKRQALEKEAKKEEKTADLVDIEREEEYQEGDKVKKPKKVKRVKKPETKSEGDDNEEQGTWSDVKACKREIIGIYTRGTFNPALVT